MKTTRTPNLPIATLIGAVSLAMPVAQAEDLDTRIGRLAFTHPFAEGYPTLPTAAKLYDEMDFQRACQAYLWSLPIVGFAEWQRAHEKDFGAGNGDIVSYKTYDDKLGLITANATTPYLIGFVNLTATGPLVVEIPPQGIAAAILILTEAEAGGAAGRGRTPTRGGAFTGS